MRFGSDSAERGKYMIMKQSPACRRDPTVASYGYAHRRRIRACNGVSRFSALTYARPARGPGPGRPTALQLQSPTCTALANHVGPFAGSHRP
eukprot:6716423-Prymnesium_polylepis.1